MLATVSITFLRNSCTFINSYYLESRANKFKIKHILLRKTEVHIYFMETQYLILIKKSTYNVKIRKKCMVLFEIDHYDV